MRKILIAGNWKMNGTASEAAALLSGLSRVVKNDAEMLICPPFTALSAARETADAAGISLGAQNVYPEKKGAFTGEISPDMLREAGCTYCIVGHSERRQILGETNDFVNRKMRALFEAGLTPILCVGETKDERAAGKTEAVLGEEIDGGTEGLSAEAAARLVVAYEPIWAIGTGESASAKDAEAACHFIRKRLAARLGAAAESIRILYGGSVTDQNISDFLKEEDIDGALVGGASLKADTFISIYEQAGKDTHHGRNY